MSPDAGHAARCARLGAAFAAGGGAPLGLAKTTSNLFRDRRAAPKRRLDLGEFDHVLGIDRAAGTVDVEGLTTYEALVAATLPHGVMPAVVPQLKTITVGGAAAGVAIEATSYRAGLVHHTMRELEVLLPGGDIVLCTPGNEHADLFGSNHRQDAPRCSARPAATRTCSRSCSARATCGRTATR